MLSFLENIKNKKIRFRTWFILSTLFFLSFFITLFLQKKIISAGLFFLLFDLALGFLAFEKTNFTFKKTTWILAICSLLLIALLPSWNRQTILSVLISLFSIIILRNQQKSNLWSFRKFQAWDYFSSGSSILMGIFSLIFGFALLGNFQSLPFNCDEIENLSQHFNLFSQQTQEMEKPDADESFLTNLELRIKHTKGIVWDNIITTQKELNHQVCLSMYQQVQKVYNIPAFQLAFLFALYMLSFWVMRFVLNLIAIFWVVIFRLLNKCGIYHKKNGQTTIETIE